MTKKITSFLVAAAMLSATMLPAFANDEIIEGLDVAETVDLQQEAAIETYDEAQPETFAVNDTLTVYDSYTDLEKTIDAAGVGVSGAWSWKVVEKEGAFVDPVRVPKHNDGSANLNFANNTRPVTDFAARGKNEMIIDYLATESSKYATKSSMSKYWMRTSPDTKNPQSSVAKVFTAPKSGTVIVSAKDINGAAKIWGARINRNTTNKRDFGATLYVIKSKTEPAYADYAKKSEFTHTFKFTEGEPAYEAKNIDFTPIVWDIEKDEKIYFIVNAADSKDAHAKYVHWNPVVTYSLDSIVTGEKSSDLNKAYADDKFTVQLKDVSIDGGMTFGTDNVAISPNKNGEKVILAESDYNKSFILKFENLQSETAYTVTINGIKISGTTDTSYTSFEFTTRYSLTFKSYDAQGPWPKTVINTTILKDEMEKDTPWLNVYSDDAGETYRELTEERGNWTRNYVAPKKVGGKDTDYSYVQQYTQATSSRYTRVLSSKQENPDSDLDVAVIGKWWMRAGRSTNVQAARQFTVPESGTVAISAVDEDGASYIYKKGIGDNASAADVMIVKRPKDVNDNSKDKLIWSNSARLEGMTTGEFNDKLYLAKIKFDEIPDVKVEKGDKLLFVAYSAASGSSKNKYVYWNPVITYTDVTPVVEAQTPADGEVNVALNAMHELTFDYVIEAIGPADVEVSCNGEPDETVTAAVGLNSDGKILSIEFSGLKAFTEYQVTLNSLKVDDSKAKEVVTHTYTFETGSAFQIEEEVQLKGGSLVVGENTFTIGLNNASGTERKATLIAVLCKGTKDNYEVESTIYTKQDIEGFTTLRADVDLDATANYFVKTIVIDDGTGKPIALNKIQYFGLTQ